MGAPMHKINVDLKHCYGIKALKHTFDFSDRRAYAVYALSLAKIRSAKNC
jgi:hypothetical protein